MPYNLLDEKWLPVRRADGAHDIIAPWQIVETENPVVALNAPRADFNGALIQFLIGLVQTAFAPEDEDAWFDIFHKPPAPETLKAAFEVYRDAFNLDGDGPRFMQDLDELAEQKPLPITVLLMDTMGSETHFVKDLPQQGMSPAMAAMALYTLQTNAPGGGAGHRTSMRGGGPLTTLVLCTPVENNAPPVPLWQTIWLNILEKSASVLASEHQRPQDIFPWLAATRTSEKNSKTALTAPEQVNPLQMFWGMPRRIRLVIDREISGSCGFSDENSDFLVREYRTKNYGINYPGELWQHVLSPHSKDVKQTLPIHPRGAVNYRHWLGLAQKSGDQKTQRVPAKVISQFTHKRASDLRREGVMLRTRLWAFGYDMDNMKPRCWYEAAMPLFHFANDEDRQFVEQAAENMIKAAGEFVGNLRSCLKLACFGRQDPSTGKYALPKETPKNAFEFALDAFWQDTEGTFYHLLDQIAAHPQDEARQKVLYEAWHTELNQYTLNSFDRWANTNQIGEQTHPKRIAQAHGDLKRFNRKKEIKKLLDLS
jgi:CRISPR system Cascade subunit CasA